MLDLAVGQNEENDFVNHENQLSPRPLRKFSLCCSIVQNRSQALRGTAEKNSKNGKGVFDCQKVSLNYRESRVLAWPVVFKLKGDVRAGAILSIYARNIILEGDAEILKVYICCTQTAFYAWILIYD